MPRDLGLLIHPGEPVSELVHTACRAEEAGYGSLWIADEKFFRDPWVVLTAVAAATTSARLGTGVTEPYARHPALIAAAMATLAELHPDRELVIGLGAGGPGFPPMGVVRRKPTKAIAEAVTILRGLLAGERVELEGEVVSFRGGSLNFASRSLPIYVAARAEGMLATAGAVADGVILGPYASREALEYAIGVADSKREGTRPKMVARVDICIAPTREAAREAVRTMVALPVWVSYPNLGYVDALGIRLPDELVQLIARREYGDIPRAGQLLPPEMIEHYSIAGTQEDVAERLRDIRPLVDELIVHPVAAEGGTVSDVADAVAPMWSSLNTAAKGGNA
ncbi:MAG TPA: LLM class flavin-dependent oxidoreductase [Gaiellaceae bacterium]|nr:LLM class flavin-dependent oxidoreductase [Gaiellaceae bacterium]